MFTYQGVLQLRDLSDNNDSLAVELDNEQVHMTASSDIRDPYFCHIDFGRTMSARKIKLISKGINKRFIVCEVDVFYGKLSHVFFLSNDYPKKDRVKPIIIKTRLQV